MKKQILFLVMMAWWLVYTQAQDINITFSAQGAATTIDEVVAKNLTTDESVTLPGDATLVLHSVTSNIDEILLNNSLKAVPNPFNSITQLYYRNKKEQKVLIKITSVNGKGITQFEKLLYAGDHLFQISAGYRGIYILSMITPNETQSIKIMQNETGVSQIEYMGAVLVAEQITGTVLKRAVADYVLNYSTDDIISYTITSGDYTTIINESPSESTTLTADMVECTDGNENSYAIVKIGDQYWMAENIASTKYADGTPITLVTDNDDWIALGDNDTDKGCCYYNNDENSQYGVLYTWAAAMNGTSSSDANPSGVQGVCPNGWHLPSDAEWTELTDHLGGSDVAGGKLKETGTTHWETPNTGATNKSGFYALPSGQRSKHNGGFYSLSKYCSWWSTTQRGDPFAWHRYLKYDDAKAEPNWYYKSEGFSVRCVKN